MRTKSFITSFVLLTSFSSAKAEDVASNDTTTEKIIFNGLTHKRRRTEFRRKLEKKSLHENI